MLSYSLARDQIELTDGLVPQGLLFNATLFPDFILGGNFVPASTLTSAHAPGYFTAAMQTNFFPQGQFDPETLSWVYQHGQPVTLGELLTIGGMLYRTSAMTGPVMVITGERDLPFCFGDCFANDDPKLPSDADTSKDHFPAANGVNVTIVPCGGHALNMEYRHQEVHRSMNEFLVDNDLGSTSL
jgi:pimeloyl-ACP methyl ester carboxylesterase